MAEARHTAFSFLDLPCELRKGLNEPTLVRAAIDIVTKYVLAFRTESNKSRRGKQSEHALGAHVSPTDYGSNRLHLHLLRTFVRASKTLRS